jgi:hypothetical protein
MDWLQTLRDLSILLAALIGAYGFDSWRREHTGKRRIELAEDALANFYEARDAIAQIRNPGSFSDETKDVVRGESESEEQFRARKNASIVFVRYNAQRELFSKIHALRYRFMAQIGPESAKPFDDLHKVVNEIFLAARMLSRLWPKEYHLDAEAFAKHSASIEKYEAVFWSGMTDDDRITNAVNAAVSELEMTCRGVIEGEGSLFAVINKRITGKS